MVYPSNKGDKDFTLEVTVSVTFDLLTQKGSRKGYLGEINLKVMSGQDFATLDGQTDDMCHNIIRHKVLSDV